MKKYIKYTVIAISLLLLGGIIGAAVVLTVLGKSYLAPAVMIQEHTFSKWYGTAWQSYNEQEPDVALWNIENVLEFYEKEYPLRGSENESWSIKADMVRLYTKAAILNDKLGNNQKYKRHIEAALKISSSSSESVFKRLNSEEALLKYEKEWETAVAKLKEKHNKKLHGNGKDAAP